MAKVISLLQPWATLVVIGAKKIETRSWDTKHRGDLLIHASQKFTRKQADLCQLWPFNEYIKGLSDMPLGKIIGAATLWDTRTSEATLSDMKLSESEGTQEEYRFGDYSPNRFCWFLRNPFELYKHIPVKGSLGLWNYEIDHPLIKKPCNDCTREEAIDG